MKFLSFLQLRSDKGIDYSRRHVRRLELDNKFPKSVPISAGRIAWIETEVDAWLADKVAQRDAGTAQRLPHVGIATPKPAPNVHHVARVATRRTRGRHDPRVG